MEHSYPYRFGALLESHNHVAARLERYLRNRPELSGVSRETLEEIAADIRRTVERERAPNEYASGMKKAAE